MNNHFKTKWLTIHILTSFSLVLLPIILIHLFNFGAGFIAVTLATVIIGSILLHVNYTYVHPLPEQPVSPVHMNEYKHANGLSELIKHSGSEVAHAAKSLRTFTDTSTEGARDITTMMEGVANMARKNAQLTEVSSDQVYSLENYIVEIHSSSKLLNASSDLAQAESSKGQMVVADLITQSENTSNAIHRLIEALKETSNRMLDMHKITNSILEISGRTHLLALNAAIESARAGVHGRGFSVLASEIGQLADQSKQSSVLIQNMIGGVSDQMRKSLKMVEEVDTALDNQIKSVSMTLTAFNSIGMSIVDMADNVESIQTLTDKISEVKDTLVDMVDQITMSSQMTSSTTLQATLIGQQQVDSLIEMNHLCDALERLSSKLIVHNESAIRLLAS